MKITQDGRILVGGTELNVPDYVFRKDYRLRSLADLERYIREKGHLPDISDAEQIQQEGLSLTDMQMVLLEKVEELTLYAIQQDKRIEALTQRLANLESE